MEKFGKTTAVVNCAGIGGSQKMYGKNGPFDLVLLTKIIHVNLIGTFNVIRLAAEKMSENEPNEQGERGVIVNTASAAAFEGKIGVLRREESLG